MAGIDKLQSTDMVNEARLQNVAGGLREGQNSLNARFDAEAGQPLRLFASAPADSKLNIALSAVTLGDGGSRTFFPIDGLNQSFNQTTVDFQTGAVSIAGNVTLLGTTFSLPASITGQFRRVAFVYLNSGKVDCVFSPNVSTYAGLQDVVSLFSAFPAGRPLGYIDVVGTATSSPGAYKSASSAGSAATNIIANSVASASSIVRFLPTVQTATGDASALETMLNEELAGSQYDLFAPVIFSKVSNTFTDGAVSTGTAAGNNYQMTTGQIFATKQLLDSEYLTDPANIYPKILSEVNLTAFWDITRVDPAAVYQVSRDGGNEYQTVTMARLGQTATFQGNIVFTEEASQQALVTQASSSTQKELNTTTALKIGESFVVTGAFAVKSVDLYFVKTGQPLGKFYVALVRTSSNLPSTNFIDQLCESAAIDVSTLTTGPVNVALPATALQAGTYQFVIRSDAAYQASFVTGVTSLAFSNMTTGSGASIYSATTGLWTASATDTLKYTLKGSSIDLRVKITASTGTVALQGLGAFVGRTYNGVSSGVSRVETITFNSTTDNRSTFTMTKFLPDIKVMTVDCPQTGQIWSYPAFQVNGYQVIFPTDSFKNRGIDTPITLNFRQNVGQNIDASDVNGSNINALSQWAAGGLIDDLVTLTKVAAPFTTVVKRAQMVDLSADLMPRMGIDRIMTQTIMVVTGESGPNGETVYKPVNDKFDQIRFMGPWSSVNDNYGQRLTSSVNSTAAIEVSFYGTGLNLLCGANDNSGLFAAVDGGTAASFFPTSTSGVTFGRNYATNTIVPVTSGLTLGLHTVKLTAPAGYFDVNGFEIINEGLKTTGNITSGSNLLTSLANTVGVIVGASVSGTGIPSGTTVSSISGTTVTMSANATATTSTLAVSFGGVLNIAPGSSLTRGKKLTSSATYAMYNSGFETGALGTKGGRVLVYQKSDGTIGKAVNPVDASTLYTTNVSHTNEDVIRSYYWREFGAGRTDDFSTVTANRTSVFTLDDGATCLTSSGVSYGLGIAGSEIATLSTTNDFFLFTFVGTGLDLVATVGATTGTLSTYTASVDGATPAAITFDQSNITLKTYKIASGLPYGSHTVKILMTALNTTRVHWTTFIVYGPKKPVLPSGAIELADYNILANYVASTGNAYFNGVQGAIRKASAREYLFSGTWSGPTIDVANFVSGLNLFTTTNGNYFEYSFFGTGFEVRIVVGTSSVTTGTVSVDGSTNLSGYTTSFFGTNIASFTASTGAFATTTTGTSLGGITVSGLPLGFHKLRVTQTSTAGLYADVIDIITPIHSYKNNGPYIVQNTLSVGNQGVSDNRQLAARFNDQSPAAFAAAVVVGSTTSTNPVPLGDMEATVYLKEDGFVDVSVTASVLASAANYSVISVGIDGVLYPAQMTFMANASGEVLTSAKCLYPVTKGYHHVKAYIALYSASGTLTWNTNTTGDNRNFTVTTKYLRS